MYHTSEKTASVSKLPSTLHTYPPKIRNETRAIPNAIFAGEKDYALVKEVCSLVLTYKSMHNKKGVLSYIKTRRPQGGMVPVVDNLRCLSVRSCK